VTERPAVPGRSNPPRSKKAVGRRADPLRRTEATEYPHGLSRGIAHDDTAQRYGLNTAAPDFGALSGHRKGSFFRRRHVKAGTFFGCHQYLDGRSD